MVCDGLRWSVMLLKAKNCKKMTHLIAACGRALTLLQPIFHQNVDLLALTGWVYYHVFNAMQ